MKYTSLATLLIFVFLQSCFFIKKSNKIYAPEMVYIPEGTFLMGDIFERENTDALPVHIVEVSAFYIGRYEVTFEQTITVQNIPNVGDIFGGNLGNWRVNFGGEIQFSDPLATPGFMATPSEVDSNIVWVPQSLIFTATATEQVLSFVSNEVALGAPGNASRTDMGIDDISIAVIPEPSGSLLIALGGFLTLTRRKR